MGVLLEGSKEEILLASCLREKKIENFNRRINEFEGNQSALSYVNFLIEHKSLSPDIDLSKAGGSLKELLRKTVAYMSNTKRLANYYITNQGNYDLGTLVIEYLNESDDYDDE